VQQCWPGRSQVSCYRKEQVRSQVSGLRFRCPSRSQVRGSPRPGPETWDLTGLFLDLYFFHTKVQESWRKSREGFWWTPVDDIPTNNKEFGHPQVVSDLLIFQQRKNLFTELVKGGRDTSEIQCVIRFGKKWTCPILFLQKYSFMINLKKKTYHILFLFFLVVIMLILLFWSF
jgi:hypothetical protein